MKEVKQEIIERSKHDVVIYNGLRAYENGHLTYQQMLEEIVIHFSKENENLTSKLVELTSKRTTIRGRILLNKKEEET